MAFNSFNNKRFRAPMFNQNYPRRNSKINFNADRFRPQFQRLNVPSRPFQPPERFPPQVFQNRPHFSSFPGATGANNYMSRSPCPSAPHIVPPPSSTTHINPSPSQQNFPLDFPGAAGPNNFMSRPPCPSSSHINAPPSTATHFHPAHPQQNFPFNSPVAAGANNFMSRPPCPPSPHITVLPSTATHIHSSPPQQSFCFNSAGATGANNFMNRPPCPSSPHINAPPSSTTRIHKSPPLQNFRFNSPYSRKRFNGLFDQPFRPLNNPPPFGDRRHPFQNRFRAQIPSHHNKDHSVQPNKKKQKTREVRKLKVTRGQAFNILQEAGDSELETNVIC